MSFFTKVTANPNATQETLERQHVVWNKGLKETLDPAVRARITASWRGKKHSAETRAIMSAKGGNQKGKKRSAETLAKMSAAQLGKKHSAETLAKMSKARKGRPKSAEHRAKIGAANGKSIMTPHGLFPSVNSVAEASGFSRETVRNWIKKYPKHYYYVNKEAA